MKFDFNDLWVLHSIFHTEEKGKGANLGSLINYADYTNHAVITYEELQRGLSKLGAAGLIIQKGNCFQTSRKYKLWWTREFKGKKSVRIDTEHKAMRKYLEDNFAAIEPDLSGSIALSQPDFDQALQQYLGRMDAILKK